MAIHREGRIRRLRVFFVSGVFALVAVAFSAVPSRAVADGFVTFGYSGTWDEAFVDDPSNPALWQQSMHFVWDEHETVHVGGNPTIVTVRSRQLTISGTFSSTNAPPNQALNCTATYSVRKGGQFPLLITTSGPVNNPRLDIAAIAPRQGRYAQSSGTGECALPANGGAGASGSTATSFFEAALAPQFTFNLNRRSYTRTFKTFDLNPNGTKRIAVSSIFRAATNGNRPPSLPPLPPLSTPVRDLAKRNALNALRATVMQALYPCTVGVGVGSTLLGAGPVGVAAGLVLVGVGSPLCAAMIKTITDEERTYKDPPRYDYFVVARVAAIHRIALRAAPCSRFSGSTKTFCVRLAAAAAGVLNAFSHTEALAAALDATVSRDTAAANAQDQAAVNLQEQVLKSLARQFGAARRAQSTAATTLRTIMRSAGISVRISVAQFKLDAKALLRAVAANGVSSGTLKKLAGSVLRPVRFDPIAAL